MADEFSLLSTVQEWYVFLIVHISICALFELIDIFPWRWVKKRKAYFDTFFFIV